MMFMLSSDNGQSDILVFSQILIAKSLRNKVTYQQKFLIVFLRIDQLNIKFVLKNYMFLEKNR